MVGNVSNVVCNQPSRRTLSTPRGMLVASLHDTWGNIEWLATVTAWFFWRVRLMCHKLILSMLGKKWPHICLLVFMKRCIVHFVESGVWLALTSNYNCRLVISSSGVFYRLECMLSSVAAIDLIPSISVVNSEVCFVHIQILVAKDYFGVTIEQCSTKMSTVRLDLLPNGLTLNKCRSNVSKLTAHILTTVWCIVLRKKDTQSCWVTIV